MPYDPDQYVRVLNAFCHHVNTLTWRNPDARYRIAFRPVNHPEGPALATVIDDRETTIPDGWAFASAVTVPRNLTDAQRARWIDNVLRRLPILPERGRDCPIAA